MIYILYGSYQVGLRSCDELKLVVDVLDVGLEPEDLVHAVRGVVGRLSREQVVGDGDGRAGEADEDAARGFVKRGNLKQYNFFNEASSGFF